MAATIYMRDQAQPFVTPMSLREPDFVGAEASLGKLCVTTSVYWERKELLCFPWVQSIDATVMQLRQKLKPLSNPTILNTSPTLCLQWIRTPKRDLKNHLY
jgi:hypothetical protein